MKGKMYFIHPATGEKIVVMMLGESRKSIMLEAQKKAKEEKMTLAACFFSLA